MKLKNKIVALALVVASAFGLAVSNRATKVEAAEKYVQVTDVANLNDGDTVIIVSPTKNKVMSTTGEATNYRGHEDITFEDDGSIILDSTTAYVLTLIKNSDESYSFDCGNGKYLSLNSSANNLHLATSYTSNNQKWTISITDGKASIATKAYSTRLLQYNASSPRFACYSSTQTAVAIYELSAGEEVSDSQLIANLSTKVQLGLVASNLQAQETTLYEMVTDVNELEDGDQIIIAAHSETHLVALGENRGNNHYAREVSRNADGIYNLDVNVLVLTVGINEEGYYTLDTGAGYLYAAGSTSSGNYLKVKDDVSDLDAQWTIAIDEEGKATIQAQGDAARDTIYFNLNSNNPQIFSCYNAIQLAVGIFKDNGNTTVADAAYSYFSDVKLRFVAEIPAELAAAIDADGEFGIHIVGETKEQDIVLDPEHWVEDAEGNVSFAVVVNVPNDIAKYDVELTGQAYVTVGGERVNLGERTCSVNGLVADDYLGGKVSLTDEEVSILKGFQKFVAENA